MAKRTRCFLLCFLLLPAPVARAGVPESALASARSLAAQGDQAGAEAAYDEVLRQRPANLDARLGRGHVRSFQRKYAAAEEDFEAVLAAEPRSLSALNGMGYSLAWSGQMDDAERVFRRTLEVSPSEPDAVKGLAYVALWRGQAQEAVRRFETAATSQPGSAELQTGLGQALWAAGRRDEAGQAFTRALELDPGREEARRGLLSLRSVRPGLDLTVLGSLTAVAARREPGVRFAELALAPREGLRAWLQYDDSLSLDNPALARAGRRVPSFWAGGLARYGEIHTTRLEAGYRRLEQSTDQWMVRGEQVLALSGGTLFKAGGLLGPRSDSRLEAVGHLGLSLPLSARLRLEPTAFAGRTGVAGEQDLRAQLAARLGFESGMALSGGVATGRSFRPAPAHDGTPWSTFLGASVPIARSLRAQALASREWPAAGPPVTVLALGFTVSLGGQP